MKFRLICSFNYLYFVVFVYFEKVKQILDIGKSKLSALFIELDISILTSTDLEFLSEYIEVMKPIAEAIKASQKEKFYFGSYLPLLFTVEFLFKEIERSDHLKHCKPLLNAVMNGFNQKFGEVMSLNTESPKSTQALIAMLVNPNYKLHCISPDVISKSGLTSGSIKQLILNAGKLISTENQVDSTTESIDNSNQCNFNIDNFRFKTYNINTLFGNNLYEPLQREIDLYFTAPCGCLEQLNSFPTVKQLFLKFNCIMCSESIMERIFSYGGRWLISIL